MRGFRGRYGPITRRIERIEPVDPLPEKSIWWAPMRGWILMIAWLFFSKRDGAFRAMIVGWGVLFVFAVAVVNFRNPDSSYEFWRCVILREVCAK